MDVFKGVKSHESQVPFAPGQLLLKFVYPGLKASDIGLQLTTLAQVLFEDGVEGRTVGTIEEGTPPLAITLHPPGRCHLEHGEEKDHDPQT
jgi:hypothetical protein